MSGDRPVSGASTPSSALYPMGVAERLTGLTRRQIRYYEARGLLCPSRTRGGHRLFSPSEVRTMVAIRELLDRGFHTLEAVRATLVHQGGPQQVMIAQGLSSLQGALSPQGPLAASHPGDAAFRLMAPLIKHESAGVPRRLGRR